MKKKLVLFLFVLFVREAAAEIPPQRIKLNSETNYVKITGAPEKVILYGISEGNLTRAVQFGLTIPKGTKIRAEVTILDAKENALEELKGNKEFYPIELSTLKQIEDKKRECVEISAGEGEDLPEPEEDLKPSDFPEMSSPVCDAIAKKDREAIRVQMEATFGGKWTLGNVCGFLVSVALNPDFDGNNELCKKYDWLSLLKLGVNCYPGGLFATIRKAQHLTAFERKDFYGILRKDACGARTSKYLIRITLNFSGVHAATSHAGVATNFRFKEYKKTSELQASVKPVSEGRYAPRPLMMMNWLGSACGNTMSLTKWNKNMPGKAANLPIYSFLIYKDMILGLSVADKVLKGGKGTFDLTNSLSGYGVCMDLVRKRQKVNGYP